MVRLFKVLFAIFATLLTLAFIELIVMICGLTIAQFFTESDLLAGFLSLALLPWVMSASYKGVKEIKKYWSDIL